MKWQKVLWGVSWLLCGFGWFSRLHHETHCYLFFFFLNCFLNMVMVWLLAASRFNIFFQLKWLALAWLPMCLLSLPDALFCFYGCDSGNTRYSGMVFCCLRTMSPYLAYWGFLRLIFVCSKGVARNTE